MRPWDQWLTAVLRHRITLCIPVVSPAPGHFMNPRVMLAAQQPLPLIEPSARQVGVVFGSSSLPVAVDTLNFP